MAYFFGKEILHRLFSQKNWEDNISRVCVEACDCSEDPLGYRAVYFMGGQQQDDSVSDSVSFVIGASFLLKREANLRLSGYKAPMTHKAISLIESKTGLDLSVAA